MSLLLLLLIIPKDLYARSWFGRVASYIASGFDNDDALIRYCYIMITIFVGIILGVLLVLLINRMLLGGRHQKVVQLKKKYDLLLTGIIYIDDEELGDENWKREKAKLVAHFQKHYLHSRFNREVLVEQLLSLHRNFSGTTATVLRNLYLELGLPAKAIAALKTENWSRRAASIRELAQMEIVEAAPMIRKSLTHLSPSLRLEAGIALLKLDKTDPFALLNAGVELTSWQQLNLLDAILRTSDIKIPSFKKWLDSPQPSVIVFALVLVDQFKQFEAEQDILLLLAHPDEKVRKQAIICLGNMEAYDAGTMMIDRFDAETPLLKIEIVVALGRISSEEAIDFLKKQLYNESFDIALAAAVALNRSGPGGQHFLKLAGNTEYTRVAAIIKHALDERLNLI